MAVSPDRRYVVTVNAGYGTYESQYEQSLAVLDTTDRARWRIFPMTGRWRACEADALFGTGVQPRWEPSLRQHGVDDGSAGRGEG